MAAMKAAMEQVGIFDAMEVILQCHKNGAIKVAKELNYHENAIAAIKKAGKIEEIEEIMIFERREGW